MPVRAATIWDEASQGDLSGNAQTPTSLLLTGGSNDLFASSQGGDLEYVTVTVPEGSTMSGLFLRAYTGFDQTSFLAVQRGTTFTESPSSPNVANLLGYSHFGPGFLGTNMLVAIGNGPGAQGFTPPLAADSYTFWLQQLGGATNYQLDFVVSTPPPPTWNVDADGDWSAASNWAGGVPDTVDKRAVFGAAITAPRTVSVDRPISVGHIELDNANAYTIAGLQPLAMAVTSGASEITVASGSHAIDTRVLLAGDAVVDVAPAASNLTIGSDLLGVDAEVIKKGAGTLSVNHVHAAALSIDNGKVALLPGGAGNASFLGALSIAGTPSAPTARLDLNDGAAIVDYSGTSPAADLRSQILAGRGGAGLGASWNGPGITSATAAAAEVETRSVGFAENGTLPLGAYTTFRGQPVDDTSVLLAFTRTGDANLDGIVNDDDVTILGASYAPGVPQASWALGDFDYNGFVDDEDVTLLGAFYDPAAEPLIAPAEGFSSGVAAVPEPSSVVLALVAGGIVATAGLRLGLICARAPRRKET